MKIVFYATTGYVSSMLEIEEDIENWEDLTDEARDDIMSDILNSNGLEFGYYEKGD